MVFMKKIKLLIPEKVKKTIKSALDRFGWFKNYRKLPIILENKYGIKFILYPWNYIYVKLALSSHDNEKEFAALSKLTKPGDTIFDVGSNIGMVSIFLSKLTKNIGTVYSFEPVTNTYDMLLETIAINRCRNILTHKIGFSDSIKEAEIFTFAGANHTLNSLGKVNIDGLIPASTEIIKLDTIDSFCHEHKIEKIDLLKVDVEGFEDSVFLGAKNYLLNNKIKYIQFEISEMPLKSIGKNSQDIFDILHRCKYKVYRFNLEKQIFEGPISERDNDFDNYYASQEDLSKM